MSIGCKQKRFYVIKAVIKAVIMPPPTRAIISVPSSMKAPSDKRNVWRGGVLQIWVTRACDMACFHCTQGSNLGGKPGIISVDQYAEALASLEGYFGVVGMFGGNPAVHPQFGRLCKALRESWVPFEQRGLWCNHPRGNGSIARITFNPQYSNLNVHVSREAYNEFARDWPESVPYLKGLALEWPEARGLPVHRVGDARHSPVYVAMQDLPELTDEERWQLIGRCDVNQYWSAMICIFRGELRAYFCEIAGAQAMLHQYEPDYPDLGLLVKPGWWRKSMAAFEEQVKYHCFACGFPLRGYGDLAIGGELEQVSKTHASIYKPKVRGRQVELVDQLEQVKPDALVRGTDYIQNGAL
jgi:hypothetical protein